MFVRLVVLPYFFLGMYFANGFDCRSDAITSSCRILQTTDYGYNESFPVENIKKNDTILLSFYVKADNNALIAFSFEEKPQYNSSMYEILLDGLEYSNHSAIRTENFNQKKYTEHPKNLSPIEWRGFWINITRGHVQVGKQGNTTAFLEWQDENPFDVKYYSFSSWDSSIRWAHQCRHQIRPEKLRNDLFKNYDRSKVSRFAFKYQTQISISILYINLDDIKGILYLNGLSKIIWSDDFLQWNPQDYDDQYVLNEENYYGWKPDIRVAKGIHNTNIEPFSGGNTTITNDGIIIWTPSLNVQTKCDVEMKNWPWDSHTCEIHFIMNTKKIQFSIPEIEYTSTISTWTISGTRLNFMKNNSQEAQDTFSIEITLRRNIPLLQFSLCFAFIVTSTVMLGSFLISPLSSAKMITIQLSLLFGVLYILMIANSVPKLTEEMPETIVQIFILFCISGLSNCFSIYLVCLVRKPPSNPPLKCILYLVNSRFSQTMLFLPLEKDLKNFKDLRYNNNTFGARTEETENLQNEIEKLQENNIIDNRRYWFQVAVAIDRSLFLMCFLSVIIFIFNFSFL